MPSKKVFQETINTYFKAHGRYLPWRYEKDPYKILVSEVSLQQTQVSRVLDKYPKFLKAFPTVESLANVSLRDVLIAWQGMGYNRRAKFLQQAAAEIVDRYGGVVPKTVEKLEELPGIGNATAGAIVAYVYNKPSVFIETNIRAVFLHFFFKGKQNISDTDILPLVKKTLDKDNPREWYYALTDYGAMLKKQGFTNTASKHYTKQSPFIGSNRQLRGEILKLLTNNNSLSVKDIVKQTDRGEKEVRTTLSSLKAERFIEQTKNDKYKLR